MDPQEVESARARLEQDYLSGAISADEYTHLRRQLQEGTVVAREPEPVAEPEPPPEPVTERVQPEPVASPAEPEPAVGFRRDVGFDADPVTGAPLASWGRRAGAWFVDLFVYIGMWTVVGVTEPGEVLTSIVVIFGPTIYQWLMVGARGQTLGHMAVGAKVLRSQDAGRVSYPRALGRAASVWVLGILFLPLLVAYLWPLWDRRNQTVYDKMASTIVVVIT
jgi:uncharacterized RDD family membrane protein YckC